MGWGRFFLLEKAPAQLSPKETIHHNRTPRACCRPSSDGTDQLTCDFSQALAARTVPYVVRRAETFVPTPTRYQEAVQFVRSFGRPSDEWGSSYSAAQYQKERSFHPGRRRSMEMRQ